MPPGRTPLATARRRAAMLILIALTGCAAPPQTAALRRGPPSQPADVELLGVPFHAQADYQCGPAALAMAMNAAGIDATPAALAPQVYLPGREGSLQVEMLATTRRHGLLAYRLAPRLADLMAEVAAGNPVVVLQNLSLPLMPVWHYAVVVGFDRPGEQIVLRSGRTERQVLSFATFERTWARGGHWAMLALPPARLPASAEETAQLRAAAALEAAGQPAAASSAYAAALGRWPASLAARMGLGNSAYAQGDLIGAEAAFRQAAREHPAAWTAYNNLALVLARQGRRAPALAAAAEAVRLAPDDAQARATLAEVKAGRSEE